MKNLENLGLVEINANELTTIDGGNWLEDAWDATVDAVNDAIEAVGDFFEGMGDGIVEGATGIQ